MVAIGQIIARATKTKKRTDFLAFMDDLLTQMSDDPDVKYHVILGNYCIHKRCGERLERRPQVTLPLHPNLGELAKPD
jgi:hypothetical protein